MDLELQAKEVDTPESEIAYVEFNCTHCQVVLTVTLPQSFRGSTLVECISCSHPNEITVENECVNLVSPFSLSVVDAPNSPTNQHALASPTDEVYLSRESEFRPSLLEISLPDLPSQAHPRSPIEHEQSHQIPTAAPGRKLQLLKIKFASQSRITGRLLKHEDSTTNEILEEMPLSPVPAATFIESTMSMMMSSPTPQAQPLPQSATVKQKPLQKKLQAIQVISASRELTSQSFDADLIGPLPFVEDYYQNVSNQKFVKMRVTEPPTRQCQCLGNDFIGVVPKKTRGDSGGQNQNHFLQPGFRNCSQHSQSCQVYTPTYACLTCRVWLCQHCFPHTHSAPSARMCQWIPIAGIVYLWSLYTLASEVAMSEKHRNSLSNCSRDDVDNFVQIDFDAQRPTSSYLGDNFGETGTAPAPSGIVQRVGNKLRGKKKSTDDGFESINFQRQKLEEIDARFRQTHGDPMSLSLSLHDQSDQASAPAQLVDPSQKPTSRALPSYSTLSISPKISLLITILPTANFPPEIRDTIRALLLKMKSEFSSAYALPFAELVRRWAGTHTALKVALRYSDIIIPQNMKADRQPGEPPSLVSEYGVISGLQSTSQFARYQSKNGSFDTVTKGTNSSEASSKTSSLLSKIFLRDLLTDSSHGSGLAVDTALNNFHALGTFGRWMLDFSLWRQRSAPGSAGAIGSGTGFGVGGAGGSGGGGSGAGPFSVTRVIPEGGVIRVIRANHGSSVSIYFSFLRRITSVLFCAGLFVGLILVLPPILSAEGRDIGFSDVKWFYSLVGPRSHIGLTFGVNPFLYGGYLPSYYLQHNDSGYLPSSIWMLDFAWVMVFFILSLCVVVVSLRPLNGALLSQFDAFRPHSLQSKVSVAKEQAQSQALSRAKLDNLPTNTASNPTTKNQYSGRSGQGLLQASLVFCGVDMREVKTKDILLTQKALITDLEISLALPTSLALPVSASAIVSSRSQTDLNANGSGTPSKKKKPVQITSQSLRTGFFARNFLYFVCSIIFLVAFSAGVFFLSKHEFADWVESSGVSRNISLLLAPVVLSLAFYFFTPILDMILFGEYFARRKRAGAISLADGALANSSTATASFYRQLLLRACVLGVLFYVAMQDPYGSGRLQYISAATNSLAYSAFDLAQTSGCIGSDETTALCQCLESHIGAFAMRYVIMDIFVHIIFSLLLSPLKVLWIKLLARCNLSCSRSQRPVATFSHQFAASSIAGPGVAVGVPTTSVDSTSAIEMTSSSKTKPAPVPGLKVSVESFEERERRMIGRWEFSPNRSLATILYWFTISVGMAPYAPLLPLITSILLFILFFCKSLEVHFFMKRPSLWSPPQLQTFHSQAGILIFALLAIIPVAFFFTSTPTCGPFFYTGASLETVHEAFLRRALSGPTWIATIISYLANSVLLWMAISILLVYALSVSRAVAIASYERNETVAILRREARERRIMFRDLSVSLSESKLRGRRLMSQWVRALAPQVGVVSSSGNTSGHARLRYGILLQRSYPDLIMICSMTDRQIYHILLGLNMPEDIADDLYYRLKTAQFEVAEKEFRKL